MLQECNRQLSLDGNKQNTVSTQQPASRTNTPATDVTNMGGASMSRAATTTNYSNQGTNNMSGDSAMQPYFMPRIHPMPQPGIGLNSGMH